MHIKEIKIKKRFYNYFHNLIKTKTIETKNILIDKCKDFLNLFTRYDGGKSIRKLSLYYNKLKGTIEEYEEKN